VIEEQLLPLISEKRDYIHAEGVAMAIHGLAQSEMWQEDAWKLLCEKVYEKDFDYEIVKSTPWSVTSFTTLSGNEHIG
jgi:hypothetical protein